MSLWNRNCFVLAPCGLMIPALTLASPNYHVDANSYGLLAIILILMLINMASGQGRTGRYGGVGRTTGAMTSSPWVLNNRVNLFKGG